ncbi:hypothetical protein [Kordiimonas lacus]|uniref:Uncharacterized protein n=1 Tax=Kordiimonas lacus TaxID=637679 RepID=A0A1G6XUS1_9PROT|nr:hypothetical protein [Kordiimonas lacus]SDD81165.1 hypothetical protein SAMN04488071_1347 [Kordiimonas lacus]
MSDVSAIGGGQGFRPPPPKPLSDDQKNLISETLSNYDPDTVSEEDAQAIVSAFKDAGIRPGKELASAMEELGFDARAVGELAGAERPKGPPPPKPGEGQALNTEGLQTIEDILEDYDLTELSEEDEESILKAFEEAGLIGEEGSVFNLTV